MSPWSALAVYFIIWWVTLFAVLPFGVRSADEAGETVEAGHEPGAPVDPQLFKKAIITTIASAAIFAVFYVAKVGGWLGI
jgi:predicted secreted protein